MGWTQHLLKQTVQVSAAFPTPACFFPLANVFCTFAGRKNYSKLFNQSTLDKINLLGELFEG